MSNISHRAAAARENARRSDGKFGSYQLEDAGTDADLGDPGDVNGEALSWDEQHPDLQEVLLSAARLQESVPGAILVGGSVAALYAGHRASYDHDHVLSDLRDRYDEVLAEVQQLSSWETSTRVTKRPVTIMGEFGDIEAGLRQLRRSVPLETTNLLLPDGRELTVPTLPEALRIKAYLVVQRNQVRDFLDVAALSDRVGLEKSADILLDVDHYYPEDKDVSSRVAMALAQPEPRDARVIDRLGEYKGLAPHWQSWNNVKNACMDVAEQMLRRSDGAEVP